MIKKLGKLPAAPRATDLKFSAFLDTTALPPIPGTFGLDHVVDPDSWGMLGNDKVGDCVEAEACHDVMLETGRGSSYGQPAVFNEQLAVQLYSAIAGYVPGEPSTDRGTDMHTAMSYRQHTGVKDTFGRTHKIGAYVSVDPTNLAELWAALYIFEAVSIGVELPQSAETQFDEGKEWTVVPGSPIAGGHCVLLASKQGGTSCKVVTWGRLQAVSQAFLSEFLDEAFAFVSPDLLKTGGESYRGFNLAQLNSDLAALHSA